MATLVVLVVICTFPLVFAIPPTTTTCIEKHRLTIQLRYFAKVNGDCSNGLDGECNVHCHVAMLPYNSSRNNTSYHISPSDGRYWYGADNQTEQQMVFDLTDSPKSHRFLITYMDLETDNVTNINQIPNIFRRNNTYGNGTNGTNVIWQDEIQFHSDHSECSRTVDKRLVAVDAENRRNHTLIYSLDLTVTKKECSDVTTRETQRTSQSSKGTTAAASTSATQNTLEPTTSVTYQKGHEVKLQLENEIKNSSVDVIPKAKAEIKRKCKALTSVVDECKRCRVEVLNLNKKPKEMDNTLIIVLGIFGTIIAILVTVLIALLIIWYRTKTDDLPENTKVKAGAIAGLYDKIFNPHARTKAPSEIKMKEVSSISEGVPIQKETRRDEVEVPRPPTQKTQASSIKSATMASKSDKTSRSYQKEKAIVKKSALQPSTSDPFDYTGSAIASEGPYSMLKTQAFVSTMADDVKSGLPVTDKTPTEKSLEKQPSFGDSENTKSVVQSNYYYTLI